MSTATLALMFALMAAFADGLPVVVWLPRRRAVAEFPGVANDRC